MVRTPSGGSVPVLIVSSGSSWPCVDKDNLLAPALDERVVQPELIQSASNDEIDEVLNGLCSVVEARRQEEDRGARALRRQHRLEVDRRQRRLARHEHELPLFL